jgi:hypothetical protein
MFDDEFDDEGEVEVEPTWAGAFGEAVRDVAALAGESPKAAAALAAYGVTAVGAVGYLGVSAATALLGA